jgi:hypothetical protein
LRNSTGSLNYLKAHGAESAQLLHNIGSAYLELPDLERSFEHFSKSLQLKEIQGDVGGQALTLNNLMRVHASQGYGSTVR